MLRTNCNRNTQVATVNFSLSSYHENSRVFQYTYKRTLFCLDLGFTAIVFILNLFTDATSPQRRQNDVRTTSKQRRFCNVDNSLSERRRNNVDYTTSIIRREGDVETTSIFIDRRLDFISTKFRRRFDVVCRLGLPLDTQHSETSRFCLDQTSTSGSSELIN